MTQFSFKFIDSSKLNEKGVQNRSFHCWNNAWTCFTSIQRSCIKIVGTFLQLNERKLFLRIALKFILRIQILKSPISFSLKSSTTAWVPIENMKKIETLCRRSVHKFQNASNLPTSPPLARIAPLATHIFIPSSHREFSSHRRVGGGWVYWAAGGHKSFSS